MIVYGFSYFCRINCNHVAVIWWTHQVTNLKIGGQGNASDYCDHRCLIVHRHADIAEGYDLNPGIVFRSDA